jgi:hypothetical protein
LIAVQYFDNPAGRLHKFLADMRAQQQHLTISQALREVLSGPLTDAEVLHAMAAAMALPAQIRAQVEELDDDIELLMRWERHVVGALGSGFALAQPLNTMINQYDATDLYGLEVCSKELHRHQAERVIGAADLDRLRAELDALRDDLLASVLPADLRGFLLEHLEDMARALLNYQLYGIAAVERAYDRTTGALARRSDLTARLIRQEDSQDSVGRFGRFLAQVALAIAVAQSALALPSQVVDMLNAVEGQTGTVTAVNEVQDSQPPLAVTSGR